MYNMQLKSLDLDDTLKKPNSEDILTTITYEKFCAERLNGRYLKNEVRFEYVFPHGDMVHILKDK